MRNAGAKKGELTSCHLLSLLVSYYIRLMPLVHLLHRHSICLSLTSWMSLYMLLGTLLLSLMLQRVWMLRVCRHHL